MTLAHWSHEVSDLGGDDVIDRSCGMLIGRPTGCDSRHDRDTRHDRIASNHRLASHDSNSIRIRVDDHHRWAHSHLPSG